MTFKLRFKEEALKEWKALDNSVQFQFTKKLKERVKNLRVEASRLSGMKDCYKIKLRSGGYRLVYEARDLELIISVVGVGKRERNRVYKAAIKRV